MFLMHNSRLPADLQWISFVLECSLENTLSGLTIIIFPVQYDVNQATNDTKIKFADNVCLSVSLPVCILYNILVLNFRAKGNLPQKITLLNLDIMLQSYPNLYT